MMSWLKTAALWTGVAAGAAAATVLAVPDLRHMIVGGEGISGFTKSAYDDQGNPLSGPVAVGQTIQYVLRYKPPANGSSGPVTIVDTLSSNQTYVPGTIVAPGWTPSTPEYNLNQETYSSPGFGPGSSFVLTVPAISGSAGAPGGGGDGYEPVPVVTSSGTKVFGVNHHQAFNGKIMCWYGADLSKCAPAYPKRASTSPEQRATPDLPHAAVFDKKVYFPAARYDEVAKTTLEFGMGCWDAETDSECPFVSLPGQPSVNMLGNTTPYLGNSGTNLDGYVAGVRADPQNPSHIFVYALNEVYCVDVALPGAPACPGWTVPTISPTTAIGRSRDMFVEENGTRLFVSNTVPSLFCLNISNGSTCAGWPAGGVNGGATLATTLGPGLDSTGAMTAICLVQGFGPSNFKCFDIANGALTTSWPATLTTARIFSAYHIPGTTRVLFPPYVGAAGPQCHDFATSAPCTPFTPYWSNLSNWTDGGGNMQPAVRDYGYASDPSAPQDCIYGLGDGGNLVRFALDGTSSINACTPTDYHATFDLDEQFCFAKPKEATWTTVEIVNRPTELSGGTITLKDSSGTVIQTIAVGSANSYTVNLPATGANSSVTMDFTPAYTGGTLPTTAYQIKLNYVADEDAQICYKTTVDDCGEVSNEAVLTDEFATLTAAVNLGAATGGECDPVIFPDCLELTPSMTVNPDGTGILTLTGTTPGFSAELVTVNSQTGGVAVLNPAQTFSGGSIAGTWNLTGLVPGMVVKFTVDAVDVGGGGKPGTDECCSSTVEVTVPDVTDDEKQEDIDLEIKKTGVMETVSTYEFTLTVTNVDAPFTGQNVIVVTDTVPAGMEFTNAFCTDWNCGPVSQFPIASGGTLTCTYVGAGLLATGAVLPAITIKAHVLVDPESFSFVNCGGVGVSSEAEVKDTDIGNDHSCYAQKADRTSVEPPLPPKLSCDKRSTKLEDGACECRYANMKRKSATSCTCPSGQSLVAGKGCVKKPPLACDKHSASPKGGECACRYPGMIKSSPTACTCKGDNFLVTGVGCVEPVDPNEPREPKKPDVTGKPAACGEGKTMDAAFGCVPVCKAPMTLNEKKTACECPKDTEMKNGDCVKKSDLLDGVLDNFHFGIGIGGGSRDSSSPKMDIP